MQFGKIAAAGYKCNLRVANRDLGFPQNSFKKIKKICYIRIKNADWV